MELRKDLPIKYYIGMHRHMPTYIDSIDFLFDVSHYIMLKNKKKKKWAPSDMKLLWDDVLNVFADITDDDVKLRFKEVLSSLHTDGSIKVEQQNIDNMPTNMIYLTEVGLSKIFTI